MPEQVSPFDLRNANLRHKIRVVHCFEDLLTQLKNGIQPDACAMFYHRNIGSVSTVGGQKGARTLGGPAPDVL